MILVTPRYRKFISALAIFILIGSLTGFQADASPKARKASTGRRARKISNKKVSKQKAGNRKGQARASVRGRSSKSRAYTSSKRRGRGRVYARGRGRGRRGRWQQRVASSTPSYNYSGVHSYLTEAWSNANTAPPTERPSSSPSLSAVGPDPTPRASNVGSGTADAATPRIPGPATADPFDLNPLVLAYTSSLIERGHNPDTQGFIVSTMDGQILAEYNADRPFNPASVVKMATSLVTISRLGPDFRFRTTLYTDGTVDLATGTLHGSLYVIGSGDPAFFYENALLIADKLNRSGIRVVEGDLVVLGPFYFNFSASREMSAKGFRTTLTPETWTAAAKTAYPRFLSMRSAEDRAGSTASSIEPPSLKITGKTTTDAAVNTSTLKILAVHTSLPLVRLLKGLNDFSNNWMASVVGNMVGGPDAVERFLKTEVGLKAEELNIVTASGLGSNYISPRATLQILRKLLAYLQKERLGIEELLPVAGVDAGTLGRRFNDAYRGSVVAKTGTLSGVSALAGVAYTRTKGPLLFVIYNHGGSPGSFRSAQDETIKKLITFFGGPAPVRYSPGGGPGISDRISENSTR
jgi:D-alanyl-D-alanine carboxypeptidase/D-alanyl-D-alanine-endopeptidase (penicillin-binding protein 4)